MGNLCSIHHAKHDQLKLLAGSSIKAELLSRFIFWWQISTYKIKGSEHIWFTKEREDISNETGIPLRSLDRYIKQLCDTGLIEKTVRERFVKKEHASRTVIHIRITEKLMKVLTPSTNKSKPSENQDAASKIPDGKNLPQVGSSGNANVASPSINKGDCINNPNIIIANDIVNKGDNPHKHITSLKIEKEIGESVSDELKIRVKGMLYNVLKKRGQSLEHQDRLFAEVIFAITSKQQFKNCINTSHKINTIAKIIKKGQWKTPKGFFNHSSVGSLFRDKDALRRKRLEEEKLHRELEGVSCPKQIAEIKQRFSISQNDESKYSPKNPCDLSAVDEQNKIALSQKLANLDNEINSEGKYFRECEKLYEKGQGGITKSLIDSVMTNLNRLYEEQATLEKELNSILGFSQLDLCA